MNSPPRVYRNEMRFSPLACAPLADPSRLLGFIYFHSSCPSTLLSLFLFFRTPLHAFQLDAHSPPPPTTLRCALCKSEMKFFRGGPLSYAQVARLFCCLSAHGYARTYVRMEKLGSDKERTFDNPLRENVTNLCRCPNI